jgi:hypothetical protein
MPSYRLLEQPTAAIIVKLIEAHAFSHFRPHESRVYSRNSHTPIPQIKTQQLCAHIECRLARVVSIVSTSLTLMSQCYASRLRRDKDDLRVLAEESFRVVGERSDEDRWPNSAGTVHLLLSREGRFLQRFGLEEASGDNHKIDV